MPPQSRSALPEPQSFDRVLSSMCTAPHPVARAAAERYLGTNPGDPESYAGVADLEARTVDLLGTVVGLEDPHGYVPAGGTEANIQAVRAARNLGSSSSPNVVAPESAHFSFHKAAEILEVELRTTPVDDDFRADPDAMAAAADEDTVLLVGVAGSTEYGRVDPIPDLAAVAQSVGARVHVDAAFGGFLLPFTGHQWHFDHAAIDTMTIDPHKAGQSAIPAGGFIARDHETLDALAVETPYLESESQVTLGGTRSGAGVASAFAAISELWPDGYEAEFERTMGLADWLAGALESRGEDPIEPSLPLVTSEMDAEVFEALRSAGWRVARTGDGALRIVLMPHVTKEMLQAFLKDLDRIRG